MAFTPSLDITHITNGTILKLDDDTGEYDTDNTTGWDLEDANANPNLTDITGATVTIIYYTSSSSYTTYDPIDIYTDPSDIGTGIDSATGLSDLVWQVKTQHLKISGVSQYSDDQTWTDGVYKVIYALWDSLAPDTTDYANADYTYTETVYLNYNVALDVAEDFRDLPDNYEADICNNYNINKALFKKAFLDAAKYSAVCGNIDNIIKNHGTLKNIIDNNLTYGCSCS